MAMPLLRSIGFAIAFYSANLVMTLLLSPSLLLPFRVVLAAEQTWLRTVLWVIRVAIGISVETRGRENLPDRPVILAVKHQSAWDTLGLSRLHTEAAIVLKRELTWIPFWGWYLIRMGMIPIDRARGTAALRDLVAAAKRRIDAGRSVLIFPQGTRTPPGAKRPYLPGVAALYTALDVPVVPVALNSGMFWPRRRFIKWPGIVTVEYLAPIAPGLPRREFMKELETRIESATARLEAEAARRFPWLPPVAGAEPAERMADAAGKT